MQDLYTDEEYTPGPGRPVTVGLDGSAYADAAAVWAAHEAQRRGVELRIFTVVGSEPGSALVGDAAGPRWGRDPDDAPVVLAETQARLRAAHPELKIRCDAVAGDPVLELRAAARQAALLVVGSRGRGGFTGTTLGSVSLLLASAARCPLVVVPRGYGAAAHPGPAVGVDVHECVQVLGYALEHAARSGAGLRVVHARIPSSAHASAMYVSDSGMTGWNVAEHAVQWLKAAHAEEFEVAPEITVLRGRPGEVLVEQSRTAELIVLGSHRQWTPWAGGVGPVLDHVLRHSRCPVVVVPVH